MNVYTLIDAAGGEHLLSAGADFTTYLQRIDTPEESAFALGAPIGSFVPVEISHRYADLDGYDDELLARWKIVRSVEADPPAPLPDEVPMYRVEIVLKQQGLWTAVNDYIATLPDLQRSVAQTLLDKAPNLVVEGDFALQVKAALSLTDEQYRDLIEAAVALAF